MARSRLFGLLVLRLVRADKLVDWSQFDGNLTNAIFGQNFEKCLVFIFCSGILSLDIRAWACCKRRGWERLEKTGPVLFFAKTE